MHICGEITYESPRGNVQSDICVTFDNNGKPNLTSEARDFLHASLDEWLNSGKGTGRFVIGIEEEQSY